MNEGVTIGIILTLIFGAFFYYLYSRIGQSEKRVSLLENILLDMKVAFESSLIKREVLVEDVRQAPVPMPLPVPLPVPMVQQTYSPPEELVETVDAVESLPTDMDAVVSSSAPVETSVDQDQYDRMTNKELKEAAKAQKIKGYSSMTRKELQDALRAGVVAESGVDMVEGTMTLDA